MKKQSIFRHLSAVAFCAMVYLIAGCGSENQIQNQDSPSATNEDGPVENVLLEAFAPSLKSMTAPVFNQPELQMYNGLMSTSDCGSQALVSNPITDAISCSTFKLAIETFLVQYSATGNLSYAPSKIKIDKPLVQLLRTYSRQSKYGFVFHYGLLNDESTNDEDTLVYILSKGELTGTDSLVAYMPFYKDDSTQTDPYYVLLHSNDQSYQIIGQSRFDQLTCDYLEEMTYNGQPLTSNEPHMIYHVPEKFYEFLAEHGLVDIYTTLHLYIGHGALVPTSGQNPKHTPCFAFGNDNVFYPINNEPFHPNHRFRDKALDIGRICPPNCPTPVRNCP